MYRKINMIDLQMYQKVNVPKMYQKANVPKSKYG